MDPHSDQRKVLNPRASEQYDAYLSRAADLDKDVLDEATFVEVRSEYQATDSRIPTVEQLIAAGLLDESGQPFRLGTMSVPSPEFIGPQNLHDLERHAIAIAGFVDSIRPNSTEN